MARLAVALLGKELQQHAPALIGAAVLLAVTAVVSWTIALDQQAVTLLAAAHGVISYAGPLLALFVAERLTVHDHDAGTHEFLSALPISPISRTLIRFVLGLSFLLATGLAMLLATALLASRREGVPILVLSALALQLGVYLYAWYGLAFGIAHLGRYRWLAWWLLLVSTSLAGFISSDPERELYWFGLVLDGVDRSRLAPPWSAVPITALWGSIGVLTGFVVATWRGGWLLEHFFQPPTAELRGRLIGIGVAALLFGELGSGQEPVVDPWRSLRAIETERSTVRIAASQSSALWSIGRESAAALDSLGSALDVDRWPPLVLLRAQPLKGAPSVSRALGEDLSPCVLLVDLDAERDEIITQVVAHATSCRLAGLSDWASGAQWLVDGLAPWWRGVDAAQWSSRAAPGAGRADEAIADWLSVRRDLSPDAGSAVAWAGLRALETIAGRAAVLEVARAVLHPTRSTSWPSGLRLRLAVRGDFVPRVAHVERADFAAAWEEVLSQSRTIVLPRAIVEMREGEIVIRWEGAMPPETILEWTSLDALQGAPLPSDRTERIALDEGVTEVSLRADVRLRAAARFVLRDPVLGLVASPWVVGP